jgi:hypothetical protein
MEEYFANVNVREHLMTITPVANGHRATVTKPTKNANKCTVVIPCTGGFGLRFGSCTCEVPAKDSAPCKHMVIVVKSLSIERLTRVQIMPYWWTTAH